MSRFAGTAAARSRFSTPGGPTSKIPIPCRAIACAAASPAPRAVGVAPSSTRRILRCSALAYSARAVVQHAGRAAWKRSRRGKYRGCLITALSNDDLREVVHEFPRADVPVQQAIARELRRRRNRGRQPMSRRRLAALRASRPRTAAVTSVGWGNKPASLFGPMSSAQAPYNQTDWPVYVALSGPICARATYRRS